MTSLQIGVRTALALKSDAISELTLNPGTRLGPYEIVAPLGAGGMGEVYRARDTKLDRDVAIKVLPELFVSDPERVARFQREAKTLAALNHPHIGGIYGLEDADGVPALVLELVDGPTLADRIAQGPIPLDETLAIAKQIAEALEAAHEAGIIHRDLKPANIKLRSDGTVKVLDFGLAKALEPTSGVSASVTLSPTITTPAMMTGIGMILGTAAYMSPEQAKGGPADKRSDVWAYGCVLYEMLTGRRPFEGDDVSDTLAAVLRAEPDWSALPANVPAGIRVLIQGCLTKDRRQRVSDIAVAQFLLRDGPALAVARQSPVVPLPQPRWRSIALMAGVALLAIVLTGLGASIWLPSTRPAPRVARFYLTLTEGQLFSASSRRLINVSPDGNRIVYVANSRLWDRSLADFEAHAIPGGESVQPPAVYSPDGDSVAFYRDGGVKRIAATGGAAVTVCPADLPYDMTWHSTGIVVGQGRKGVVRCPTEGGAPQTLARVGDDEEAQGGQLLADGRDLLFVVGKVADGPSRWDKAQVVVQTLSSGKRKTLINGGTDASYVPTGHLLYALGGMVFAIRYDVAKQEVSGGAVPVLEGVRRSASANTGTVQIGISQTGTVVYLPGPVGTATGDRVLALADRAGTVTRLAAAPASYSYVRASHDGARLAVATDDGKEAIVWVYDVGATTTMRRLTLTGHNRFPMWSPDGLRIAYQSDREGDRAIFVQRADGTGVAERLTKAGEGETQVPESWSPDGQHILFSVEKNSAFTLFTLSLADKKVAPFADVRSIEPPGSVFSPDGRWVAYASAPDLSGRSPNRGVFIQRFPTGERYQIPKQERDYHPVWNPKGGELFFVPIASRLAAVSVTTTPTVSFGTPAQFQPGVTLNRLSTDVRAFDMMPDGRFVGFIYTSGSMSSNVFAPQIRVVLNWFSELQQRVPTR